jgi:RNA polymerase sigma-70 factor (ECF subfamily)
VADGPAHGEAARMVKSSTEDAALGTPVSRVDRKREAEALEYARGHQRDVALKLLMVVYGDPLAGFLSRLVSDPARIRPIYQASFLRAFRGIHRFRADEYDSVWAWLCQLTWQTFVKEEQPDADRGSGVALASQESGAAAASGVVDEGGSSPDSLMETDRTQMLERCLMELPCHRRAQLLMRFSLGLSYTEIGAAMGIDAGEVERDVSRIQPWLRRRMGMIGEGDE